MQRRNNQQTIDLDDGVGPDDDERSRPLNNPEFEVTTGAALTGVQKRKKPAVSKKKFKLDEYTLEERHAWHKVWHALCVDYFSSETFLSGSQVNTRITEIWKQSFPTEPWKRAAEPTEDDYPEAWEIRRVSSLDELVNLKVESVHLEYMRGYQTAYYQWRPVLLWTDD